MILEKYIPGDVKNDAYTALEEMIRDIDKEKPYADMMRLRVSGQVSSACNDVYYVAHELGRALARHWNGWGKHPDAIGNWGNFYTDEQYRGQGIGGKLIEFAKTQFAVTFLWALEKNTDAIRFYQSHGFHLTDTKKYEEGTTEFLVMMER